jgi:hypothetical protein
MCRRINEECRTSTRVLVSSILVLYSLCIALTAGETLTSPAIVRERVSSRSVFERSPAGIDIVKAGQCQTSIRGEFAERQNVLRLIEPTPTFTLPPRSSSSLMTETRAQ